MNMLLKFYKKHTNAISLTILFIVLTITASLGIVATISKLMFLALALIPIVALWMNELKVVDINNLFSETKIFQQANSIINNMLSVTNFEFSLAKGKLLFKSRNFFIALIVLYLLLNLVVSGSLGDLLANIIIYVPLFYVIFRGYKAAYKATMFIIYINSIVLFMSYGIISLTSFTTLIFLAISFIAYKYCIDVENAAIRLQKSGEMKEEKKKNPILDISILAVIYIVFIFIIFNI